MTAQRPLQPIETAISAAVAAAFDAAGITPDNLRRSGDPDRVLTSDEAATRLGSSRSTLSKWRMRGYGPPHVKLGRRVGYRESVLNAWLAGQERAHTLARK